MSDKKKAFWFIALLSTLVIIPFLGETIFYSKGEPREAIVAYSMLESGNWILPLNYGTDIAYKPPFPIMVSITRVRGLMRCLVFIIFPCYG